MEFLMGYDREDSEDSDNEDHYLEDHVAVSNKKRASIDRFEVPECRNDFFGLDDTSQDDDDYRYRDNVMYGRVAGPLDQLISAYQLSEIVSGPEPTSEVDVIQPTSLPKKPRLGQAICISPTDDQLKGDEVDSSKVCILPIVFDSSAAGHVEEPGGAADEPSIIPPSNNANIFVPEPRAVSVCDPHACSKLPRRPKRRLVGHAKCVNTLQWGSIESKCTHLLLSSSMDGYVRIWNAVSGHSVWNRAMSQPDAAGTAAVRCAQWCPDGGRTIATGGYDKIARLVDVETDTELFTGVHQHYVTCLRFHPTDHNLLVCGNTGRIDCWDTRSPTEQNLVRSYRGDFGEVQDLEFLPGGSEMVSCTNLVTRDSANRTIMAWDFLAGAVLSNQIFSERYHCTRLRVHPSEKYFLAQTNGNYVAIFSVDRPYRIDKKKRFEGHKVEGYWISVDVSRDGRFVYSGSADGRLHVYDFKTSATLARWRISENPCLAVECHPLLDSTIAVSDMKGDIHIWR